MKFLNLTFIKISLIFIPGILTGFWLDIPTDFLWGIGLFLFPLFIFSYFRERKLRFPDALFGCIVFLNFFYAGMLTASLYEPENRPSHFLHFQNKNLVVLEARIIEKLKPTSFNERYFIKAQKLKDSSEGIRTEGKLLLNLPKTGNDSYEVGDILLLPFHPRDISLPKNPYQFDYRRFMEKQAVYKQLNLSEKEILRLKKATNHPVFFAEKLREKIINNLQQDNFSTAELSIMQALLLGQRRDISPEVYEQYAAAGAVHILAVSGLHVGILLLILNFLLKPLERLKYGRIFKILLLLLLMWGFAMLAGLSPSVVRAVSMFSFVAIGMQLKRKTSVMNSLFISLFVLLLLDPFLIFQVGFQLSYLAVFSIVSLQPVIYGLYQPKQKFLKYLWSLLSVSIAAQIGVVPLTLYYFHQFPGLFFLSNLVVLPVLGLILGTGILVIFLSLFKLLPEILTQVYSIVISTLNSFINWVSRQEAFIFTEIPFSALQCLAAYLVVTALIFLIYRKNYQNLVLLLTTIILFQGVGIYEKHQRMQEEAFIFHKTRNSLLGIQQGREFYLYHNPDSRSSAENILKALQSSKAFEEIKTRKLPGLLNIGGKQLLVVDSSAAYELKDLRPDIVLLSHSPKINLDRLLQELQPACVVADGSNYHSAVQRWEITCQKQKIPFHHTGEKGAFRIFTEP